MQEDLNRWADRVTLDVYPEASAGEALAAKANAILENHKITEPWC